jgi:hypothetical protein
MWIQLSKLHWHVEIITAEMCTAVQRNTIHGIAFSDDSCSLYILTSPVQEITLIDSMDNARDSDQGGTLTRYLTLIEVANHSQNGCQASFDASAF